VLYGKASEIAALKNQKGRLLGIDYGIRNIGVAISDLSWSLTRALPIVDVKKTSILPFIKELIQKENIQAVIIGDPRHMSGDYSELSQKVHQFCQKLSSHIVVPIMRFDERMTSMMADSHMIEGGMSRAKRKEKIDSVAACYILQGFLDYVRMNG